MTKDDLLEEIRKNDGGGWVIFKDILSVQEVGEDGQKLDFWVVSVNRKRDRFIERKKYTYYVDEAGIARYQASDPIAAPPPAQPAFQEKLAAFMAKQSKLLWSRTDSVDNANKVARITVCIMDANENLVEKAALVTEDALGNLQYKIISSLI